MSLFLRDKDRDSLLILLDKYLPNVSAWVYGSRVKGEARDWARLPAAFHAEILKCYVVLKKANHAHE